MTTAAELLGRYTSQSQLDSYFLEKVGILSVLSYADGVAIQNGVASAFDAFTDTLAAVPTEGGIIFVPTTTDGSTYVIDDDITFPDDVVLWFAEGANIKRTSGATITLNCGIFPTLGEIFTDDTTGAWAGTIIANWIQPEWFSGVYSGVSLYASEYLSNLNTTAKDIVDAINEVDAETSTGTSGLATHIADLANPHAVTPVQVNCIAKDSVIVYTPTLDYHPATKKYADDGIASIDTTIEGIGRTQSEFDFNNATVVNVTDTDGSVTLTGGQVSGAISKLYAPGDIRDWRNISIDVADLDANNNLYYTITNEAETVDIIAQTEITTNGDKLIDISSIDFSTYPSIKLFYTIARDGIGDTSPTISNNSVAWEGISNSEWGELDTDTTTSLSTSLTIDASKVYDEYRYDLTFGLEAAISSLPFTFTGASSHESSNTSLGSTNATNSTTNIQTAQNTVTSTSGSSLHISFTFKLIGTTVFIDGYLINDNVSYSTKFVGQAKGVTSISDFVITFGASNLSIGALWKLYGRNL